MPEHPRAQLIHIDVDRRLGHEWDEWDGRPLPNHGDYDSSPALFFGWSAAALAAFFAAAALALYLLAPRLALLHPAVPTVLWITLALLPSCAGPGGSSSSFHIERVVRCSPSGWPNGGRFSA